MAPLYGGRHGGDKSWPTPAADEILSTKSCQEMNSLPGQALSGSQNCEELSLATMARGGVVARPRSLANTPTVDMGMQGSSTRPAPE